MRISMIVAAAENNVIGIDNKLPWHLPADMQFFKRTTNGHPIIMGRKSYEALGKPLPNRTNIVITRQTDYKPEGTIVVSSPEEALETAVEYNKEEIFIIGGGNIYQTMLSLANRVYLTRIHTEVEGDAYFPELPAYEWELTQAERHEADEKHKYAFTFQTWDRKD